MSVPIIGGGTWFIHARSQCLWFGWIFTWLQASKNEGLEWEFRHFLDQRFEWRVWIGTNWPSKKISPRFSQSAEGSILFDNTFVVKFAVSRCWQRWQTCTATAETGRGPQWDKGLGYMWNDHEALRGIRRLVLVKHGFRVLCYMFFMIFVSVFQSCPRLMISIYFNYQILGGYKLSSRRCWWFFLIQLAEARHWVYLIRGICHINSPKRKHRTSRQPDANRKSSTKASFLSGYMFWFWCII